MLSGFESLVIDVDSQANTTAKTVEGVQIPLWLCYLCLQFCFCKGLLYQLIKSSGPFRQESGVCI